MAAVISMLTGTFFHLVSFAVVSGNAAGIVRGVDFKHQSFYNPSQDFTCFDGSKTIPFSSVNDDYCDCVDASDEPGTSACPEGRYYCANIGYKPVYLQSSRVNDGICDCCDGSDEYDSDVACFNDCQKYGEEELERLKKEWEEANVGFETKKEYIRIGQEKKLEKQKRVDTLNNLLEQRRTKLETLKAAKEAAETPEKEAKDKQKKEWDEVQAKLKEERAIIERGEAFTLLDSDKNGWVTFTELMVNHYLNGDMSESDAKDIIHGEAMVDTEGFVPIWAALKPNFVKDGRQEPKAEEEKSPEEPTDESSETDGETPEDQEEKPVEEPPPETAPAEGDDDADDEDDEDDDGEDLDQSSGVASNSYMQSSDEQMPDYDHATKQLIEVAEEARRNYDEVDKEVRELESEHKNIDDFLKTDFGPDHEFSALKGECYEFTDREYTYKLCMFDKVTQRNKDGGSETDLGHWGKWEEKQNHYTKMKYDGGQSCWNGPARSTAIRLSCGKENIVVSVSEPSRCEYEMDLKTPALCNKVEHSQHTEL